MKSCLVRLLYSTQNSPAVHPLPLLHFVASQRGDFTNQWLKATHPLLTPQQASETSKFDLFRGRLGGKKKKVYLRDTWQQLRIQIASLRFHSNVAPIKAQVRPFRVNKFTGVDLICVIGLKISEKGFLKRLALKINSLLKESLFRGRRSSARRASLPSNFPLPLYCIATSQQSCLSLK